MLSLAENLLTKYTMNPIKLIMLFGTGGILAQATLPAGAGPYDQIGRLSLDGALILAVGVLWKFMITLMDRSDKLVALKDAHINSQGEQIVAMATKTTEVMTLVMESVKESRKATEALASRFDTRLDEVGNAMDNIAENLSAQELTAGKQVSAIEEMLRQWKQK